MEVPCPIKILNPFDERSVAWDMARDIVEPVIAQQIATILIPEEDGQHRFFPDAARHLLTGVFIAFIKTNPRGWTFRDVVLTVQSEKLLRQLLSRVPETRHLIKKYLDAKEWPSIDATIATKMAPFEAVAAAWARASESVSLEGWVKGEFILVLGNLETARAALDAINRVIFKRVSELILGQSESRTRRTWVFLDEVRDMQKLPGLSSLLTKGRSKGCAVILGFQDTEGFKEAQGERLALEIMGQCSNKIFLRLESPDAANWVAEVIGKYECIVITTSRTTGAGGVSETVSEQLMERYRVLPAELMDGRDGIPPTNERNGLTGYYLNSDIGLFQSTTPWEQLMETLRPRDLSVPDWMPRPGEHQYLPPFTDIDFKRLGLVPGEEDPTVKAESKLKLIRPASDGKAV